MSDSRDPVARSPVGVATKEPDPPRTVPVKPPPVSPTTLPAPVLEPAIPDPAKAPAPIERRLPEHKGKLARIGDAVTGLGEDLKEWIELRIQIAQTEIQEQVEFRVGQAKQGAAAALFAALGGLFFLLTLAFGIGWWLGHPFWGFLIVTLLLFAAAIACYLALKPKPPPSAPIHRPS